MADDTYLIGAGLNVAQDELVNIASIDPGSNGDPFATPKVIPMYDDGEVEQRLNKHLFASGFASICWFFTRMSYDQLYYLRSTYCSNGLSGDVTIYVQLQGNTSNYTRMNAIMYIKPPKSIRSQYWYNDVEIEFILIGEST